MVCYIFQGMGCNFSYSCAAVVAVGVTSFISYSLIIMMMKCTFVYRKIKSPHVRYINMLSVDTASRATCATSEAVVGPT